MNDRRRAGGPGDRGDAAVEVGIEGSRKQPQRVSVPVAVQRDHVAGRGDLGGQGGISLDLLSDQEEGRLSARVPERLEHGRRALRMRAVVEGDRDPAPIGVAPRHPEGPCDRRRHGRERR